MKVVYVLLLTLSVFFITNVLAIDGKVCPPCPYHPCPTDFVTLIKKDVTISVPGVLPIAPFIQVDTIQDALNALESYKIVNGATVTIQLTQNVDNYDTINITHPDGNKIHIVGNCTGSNCTIQFKLGITGVHVNNGNFLGLLDGFTLVGSSVSGAHGIVVEQRSSLICGSKISVTHFDNGIVAAGFSYIKAPSIKSTYNLERGVVAQDNSNIVILNAVADYNKIDGIFAYSNSNIIAIGSHAGNNGLSGIVSYGGSNVMAGGAISENNGGCGFAALIGAAMSADNSQAINNCGGSGSCGQFGAELNGVITASGAITKGTSPVRSTTGGRVCYVNGGDCTPP